MNRYMRVWPSGKAKASQAFIRGFESRHPLHKNRVESRHFGDFRVSE